MKVYVVTQVNEDFEWTGTCVFASQEEAMDMVNKHIDEVNERTGSRIKQARWHAGERDWSRELDGFTYHFEVQTIGESK